MDQNQINRLINAAQKYYSGLDTGMSDMEYDKLFNESGLTKAQLFDMIVIDGETLTHPCELPVWSKLTDWSLIDKYLIKPNAILTPKWDGCSTVAYYENGKLVKILTRSNEVNGKVKTKMLHDKFPNEVDPRVRAILAEALVPVSLSETRASANGLVNSKYKQDEVDKNLKLRAFDVITSEPMNYLSRIKLTQMDYRILDMEEARGINKTGTLGDFYTDGIVIYFDGGAQIFKLESATDSATVVVNKEVICESEKTSLFVTKYMFDPVVLNNVNIKCVGNCGNLDTIKERGIGIGTVATVHLAKAVIPQFKEIISKGKVVEHRYCPDCGEELEEFQGKLFCNNMDCNVWKRRLANFPTKDTFLKPPGFDPAKKSWKQLSAKQMEYVKKVYPIWKHLTGE